LPFSNLIGFWNFDGDDDSSAYDFSGSGFTGSYVGNPLSLTGLFYRSLNLDGDGDYVTVSETFDSDNFTICSWINPSSLDSDAQIFDSSGGSIYMRLYSSGSIRITAYNELDKYSSINIRVPDNDVSSIAVGDWTYVCISYNASQGNLSYYENSILRRTVRFSDETYVTPNANAFNITAQATNHLQGVDTDRADRMWWSFTDKLIISNMTDNTEILNLTTDDHEGDIAVCNDTLFVPWTGGNFVEGAYTTMRKYNATNLTLLEEVNISEHINFGAGGVTCDGEYLYVVESCGSASPNRYQDNYIYVFNQSNISQFIESHKVEVPGDHLWYCTQTITKHNDDFLLGGYDTDYGLMRFDSNFEYQETYTILSNFNEGLASWNSTHIIAAYGTGTPYDGSGGFYSLISGARNLEDSTSLRFGINIYGANPFNGSMDEIVLFDSALTSTEISELYNNQSEIYSTETYVDGTLMNITEGIKYVNLSLLNYSFPEGSDVSVALGQVNFEDGYLREFNSSGENILRAHWPADESANDGLGINNGTTYGSFSYGSGKYNSSFVFNGADTRIEFADNDNLDFGTEDFAVSAWINLASGAGTSMILNKEGTDPRWYIRALNGKLSVILDDGTNQVLDACNSGGSDLRGAGWKHIIINADRDGLLSCYVDNVLDGATADISSVGNLNNNNVLRIGRRYSAFYYFNGSIDDVMLFNSTLNVTQRAEIYERGLLNFNYTDYHNSSSGSSSYIEIQNNTDYILPNFKLQPNSDRFDSPLVYGSVMGIFNSDDPQAPAITPVSPSDGSSTTSTSIGFQFNVTDHSGVEYCSVFFDGVEYANTTAISELLTNEISISSIGIGTHSWKVYCNDSIGNEGNSSEINFTITEVEEETTTAPFSPGTPSYSVGGSDLADGYAKTIGKSWKLKFSVGQEAHQLKLDSLDKGAQTATITVSSNPQTKTLAVGEEWKVDLDADNDYDLLVRLDDVTSIRAEVFMQEINEEIESVGGEVAERAEAVEEIEEKEICWLKVIGLIILVVALLVGAFVLGKKYLKK